MAGDTLHVPALPEPPRLYERVVGYDPAGGRDDVVVVVREYTRDTFRIRLLDPRGVRIWTSQPLDRRLLLRAETPDYVWIDEARALPSAGKGAKRRLIERLQRKLARGAMRTQWERRPAGHRGVWWRE